MTVPSLASALAARVCAAVSAVAPDAVPDPQIRRSEHADFQADGILTLARAVGRSPRELAAAVTAELTADAVLAGSAVAGPGFINLTLTDRALLTQVAGRLSDRLGVPAPETGRTTVVDYSQPNIAKEMHVGHLRSTIIGDALVRVLERLGGTVVRQNHIGDWGTQFGMLIQYLDEHPHDATTGISRLAEVYRAARAAFDADDGFAQRARRRVVALQSGDGETLAAWRGIVAESTRYFTAIYAALGVRLTPADVVGESFYNPALPAVADDLERAGVATRSDGALCVFFDDVRDADGEPVPLIVRKGDGGFGYAATDLAAIRHRIGTLRADRVLYVVDARQALHFRMVFDTARRAGWVPAGVDLAHVPFGLMLGPDGRSFKSRAGDTVRLADLLADAVGRARTVVAAKHPGLDAATLDERARQVGIGALKYADLTSNRARDYVYDPARMLALAGNTSVYLQYAHARVRSILANAAAPGRVDAALPLERAERTLVLDLDAFGDTLTEVANTLEPHRLCHYLYRLAKSATAFLDRHRVLAAPTGIRENRLAFCELTGETLQSGLDLLGIEAPTPM